MKHSFIKFCLALNILFSSLSICALPQEAIDKDFVYLKDVDDTIIQSMRYNSKENFLGQPVNGYKESNVILTKQTAEALKKVNAHVQKDGYKLVVYDAYRPQKAVNNFMKWSEDLNDQVKKDQYYPRVDKDKVFELGYVAKRSGHSRGSTVDLTIIKKDQQLHEIKEEEKTLLDGFKIKFLDDGTVDMGSSFDLFDKASHYENDVISAEHKELRKYLKETMEKFGFKNYAEEWWHFTLKDEPYKADQDSSYFDFDVE